MDIASVLQCNIDNKTKPPGSLGILEKIACRIGTILNSTHPQLRLPHIIVFAADHGLAKEGVSAYPSEVTHQMVLNFLSGGAAINVFCRQHGITLKVIDAGVNFNFTPSSDLIIAKPANGTRNLLHGPAMTEEQLNFSLDSGSKIVAKIAHSGCNIIGFGEMGIGNTSAASLIVSALLNLPVVACVGRGTGISDEQLTNKIAILEKANEIHRLKNSTPLEVLQKAGGFEIAQICGALLAAHQQGMVILVDGFVATAALLVATTVEPSVIDNCIFCHRSQEQAHQLVLDYFNQDSILQLQLRLGEGTGCALAYPLVESAVRFLNEMASFDDAGVSNRYE